MFEFTRQHPSVELVELHQLNQVGEFGGSLVKAEEDLAILFTLWAPADAGERKSGESVNNFTHVANSAGDPNTLTATLL